MKQGRSGLKTTHSQNAHLLDDFGVHCLISQSFRGLYLQNEDNNPYFIGTDKTEEQVPM